MHTQDPATVDRSEAPDRADEDADGTPSRRRSVLLGLGIAGFALMALYWAAIFAGVFTGTNPDTVHDKAWVRQAAAVCKQPAKDIRDLPRAQSVKSAAGRADLVDQGTAALAPMVDRLAALPVAAADREAVQGWLADWRVYLGDRRAFAAHLRVDAKAEPLVSERHGGWVTDAIDALASANGIFDCATPGDV